MENNNVVINESKGYGYSYASLGDIARQGFTIPKMKTETVDGREYMFYKDGDEWIRGAQIIIPESKQMNAAQIYGAALSYARRYTTLMALQLACDDDKEVEDLNKNGTNKTAPQTPQVKPQKASMKPIEASGETKAQGDDQLIEQIRKLYTADEIATLEKMKRQPLEKFDRKSLEAYYEHRKPKEKTEQVVFDLTAPERPFY